MALIVEDGSGKPDAESYISVAEADAYHLKFGNTAWAGMTEPNKEIQLRRGTAYIEQMYSGKWQGQRTWPAVQALSWPRRYVVIDGDEPEVWNMVTKSTGVLVPADQVPKPVREAAAVLAISATGDEDPLLPPLEPSGPGAVKSESFKVGPIENATTYAENDGTIRDLTTRFPKLEMMLRPYLKGGAGDGAAILTLERA